MPEPSERNKPNDTSNDANPCGSSSSFEEASINAATPLSAENWKTCRPAVQAKIEGVLSRLAIEGIYPGIASCLLVYGFMDDKEVATTGVRFSAKHIVKNTLRAIPEIAQMQDYLEDQLLELVDANLVAKRKNPEGYSLILNSDRIQHEELKGITEELSFLVNKKNEALKRPSDSTKVDLRGTTKSAPAESAPVPTKSSGVNNLKESPAIDREALAAGRNLRSFLREAIDSCEGISDGISYFSANEPMIRDHLEELYCYSETLGNQRASLVNLSTMGYLKMAQRKDSSVRISSSEGISIKRRQYSRMSSTQGASRVTQSWRSLVGKFEKNEIKERLALIEREVVPVIGRLGGGVKHLLKALPKVVELEVIENWQAGTIESTLGSLCAIIPSPGKGEPAISALPVGSGVEKLLSYLQGAFEVPENQRYFVLKLCEIFKKRLGVAWFQVTKDLPLSKSEERVGETTSVLFSNPAELRREYINDFGKITDYFLHQVDLLVINKALVQDSMKKLCSICDGVIAKETGQDDSQAPENNKKLSDEGIKVVHELEFQIAAFQQAACLLLFHIDCPPQYGGLEPNEIAPLRKRVDHMGTMLNLLSCLELMRTRHEVLHVKVLEHLCLGIMSFQEDKGGARTELLNELKAFRSKLEQSSLEMSGIISETFGRIALEPL